MLLPPAQVERFYKIWKPLLLFVNRQRELVPDMLDWTADHPGGWGVQDVERIRTAMWADDALREQFIEQNPASLTVADLAIVRRWRNRVAGDFIVVRQLKRYCVFMPQKDSRTVYAVLGLLSRIDEVVPFMPCMAGAVLLPWEGRIIYDSLVNPYMIQFGSGIRRSLKQSYDDAKERGAIVTSLPASTSPGVTVPQARATNDKVLAAFRTHLFASGLSARVAERDVASAGNFAEFLAGRPEPQSLRDFGHDEVRQFLAAPPGPLVVPSGATAARTSMKRLVRFLRDTERMDYDEAEDISDGLRASRGDA